MRPEITAALLRSCAVEEDCGYETPCLIWQRSISPNGYARLRAKGTPFYVHRLLYELEVGPLPSGDEWWHVHLDHLCRQRACINPSHMEVVTHAENCRRGRKVKLSLEDARAIRTSTLSNKTLAQHYRVATSTISRIQSGQLWAEDAR
jgi:hypothetical protein